jgi:hypothetical protein
VQLDSHLFVSFDEAESHDGGFEVSALGLDGVLTLLNCLDVFVDGGVGTDAILVHLRNQIDFCHQPWRIGCFLGQSKLHHLRVYFSALLDQERRQRRLGRFFIWVEDF